MIAKSYLDLQNALDKRPPSKKWLEEKFIIIILLYVNRTSKH